MQLTRLGSVPYLMLTTLCLTRSILPCNGDHLSQRGGWMNFQRLGWSASENLQFEKVCTLKSSVIQRVQKERLFALIQALHPKLRSLNQQPRFLITFWNRISTCSHFSRELAEKIHSRLSQSKLWKTWIFSKRCLRLTSRSWTDFWIKSQEVTIKRFSIIMISMQLMSCKWPITLWDMASLSSLLPSTILMFCL